MDFLRILVTILKFVFEFFFEAICSYVTGRSITRKFIDRYVHPCSENIQNLSILIQFLKKSKSKENLKKFIWIEKKTINLFQMEKKVFSLFIEILIFLSIILRRYCYYYSRLIF